MHRKTLVVLTLASALLATLAGGPAGASAANEPELTYPTGTRLAVGSKLRADNVGDVKLTSASGAFSCSYGALTGTLRKNNGSEVEWDAETATFAGTASEDRCSGPLGPFELRKTQSWCFKANPAMKEDEIQIRGGKCSESAQAMKVSFAWPSGCVYKKGALEGSIKTHPEDAVLSFEKAEFSLITGLCASSLSFSASYTFERDEAGTKPLYVSAGPSLTFPTGTLLAAGSTIRAHNLGFLSIFSGGTFYECSNSELTGTLAKNSGTSIEANLETGTFSGTGSGGACTSGSSSTPITFGQFPWCFKSLALDKAEVRGNSCASVATPVQLGIDSGGVSTSECVYERSAASPITGTLTTHPEDAVVSVSEVEFTKVGLFSPGCPASWKLDSSFTLERDNTAEKSPAYIS